MIISRLAKLASETREWPALRPLPPHQFIASLFPDRPTRDFLYRLDLDPSGKPCYLVVSPVEPQLDEPEWDLQCKDYEPNLQAGERLSFQVRVHPSKCANEWRGERRGRGKRVDLVLDLKKHKGERASDFSQAELAREAGQDWLQRRAATHGFELDAERLMVVSYQSQRNLPGQIAQQKARGNLSTLDLKGELLVTDPVLFRKTLFEGIGPAKRLGCGLMLVRR